MPVTDVHPLYALRYPQWIRCRDAYEGSDAIKAKKTQYLPKLSNQKSAEYDAYLKRACWYGATGRTVHGLTGSIMRKPPSATVPEQVETHLQDITRTNVSLAAFSGEVVSEVLGIGRTGVMLDLPEGEQPGIPRPHWVRYDGEQILNWRSEMINGMKTLVLVVLQEEYQLPQADIFSRSCVKQYRVLQLINNEYQVSLYRQQEGNKRSVVQASSIVPKVRGGSLNYIPFVFINPLSICPEPEKPPLLDMVDVNLSHYCNSADIEHGRHYVALPTPYVTGVGKETSLSIGPSMAWTIPQAEARVGMLEFSGSGLGALERALDVKEKQMAVLGARMLEEQKLAVETAEALSIRRSGESSLLAAIAQTISTAFTVMVRWHVQWVSATQDAELYKIELNKDFFGIPMSAGELSALMQQWQSGAISYKTFYWNLQQGEITRPGVSAEEELDQIHLETPTLDLAEDTPDDEGEGEGSQGYNEDQNQSAQARGATNGAKPPMRPKAKANVPAS